MSKDTEYIEVIGMNINEINYWPCTWFREERLFTKEDFLSVNTEFFVFGKNHDTPFLIVNRGDVADVFLRNNIEEFDPMKTLKTRPYLPLSLNEDMTSIPYLGKVEKFGLLLDDHKEPAGVMMDIQNIYDLHYNWRMASYRRDLTIDFYKRIIDNIEEEIFITDEYGFIQFLNPYAEKVCGVTMQDVIGCHVDQLEEQGIISSSITKEVFRLRTTCNKLMELHTGETVLATGIPLYKNGSLCNVLATSKNIAELRNILTHLQDITSELGEKEEQIKELKRKVITQENYVMESQAMRQVEHSIEKVADTDATVLIEGESGSGKEVVAELIFKFSNRNDKPFIKINCAMIPEHLLESEFFGYEPGAFTGANKSGKKGKIEMADGGTVFLDEIGEMPLPLQAKILEFLQDQEIVRVGGIERIPVDVRVIAATNRDLKEMVQNGSFRRDLFYRLNVMLIHVSPLRKRIDDIVPLSTMFLQKYNIRFGKNKVFAPSVLTYFLHYEWPGNVRELMHTIEHLVIISDNDVISIVDVDKVLNDEDEVKPPDITISSLKLAKQELEISMVKRAYEIFRSSYKVAEMLGVSQAAVMKILKRNGYHLKNGILMRSEISE